MRGFGAGLICLFVLWAVDQYVYYGMYSNAFSQMATRILRSFH